VSSEGIQTLIIVIWSLPKIDSFKEEEARAISLVRYLEDIDEDLNNALLDMSQSRSICDSIKSEVRTYKESRMNDILYALTGNVSLIKCLRQLTLHSHDRFLYSRAISNG
jgi:hypothetical protein